MSRRILNKSEEISNEDLNGAPISAVPDWLRRFAIQRRNSGFSSTENYEVTPSPSEGFLNNIGSPRSYEIPKIKVNLGIVSTPTDVQSGGPGVFQFQKPEEQDDRFTLQKFLETREGGSLSRRGSLVPGESQPLVKQNVANTIDLETLPVLTIPDQSGSNIDSNANEEIFNLEQDEDTVKKPNLILEKSKAGEPSRLVQTILDSGWAQNWFFQNGDSSEVDSKKQDDLSQVAKSEIIHISREQGQRMREMNLWTPQNL